MVAAVVLASLLGLVVGSFLNVVVHRVPRGLSVVSPPSACPSCAAPIAPRHNVPVLGWLVLRGRCAGCAAPISVRYPLVEALTGVLFGAVTWRLLHLDSPGAVPAWLWLTGAGVALAAIDLELHRLPNRIVGPSYPVLGVLLGAAALAEHDGWRLARAALAAAAVIAFFLLLVVVRPGGMGWGDVKLSGLLGAVLGWLSWAAVPVGIFTGFLLGAVVGVVVLARGRGDRRTALPFGPFLVAGTLLALFVTPTVAGLYTV